MIIIPDTATARALNRLAREQMKLRILADVRIDLTICEIEGWDQRECIDDLTAAITSLGATA